MNFWNRQSIVQVREGIYCMYVPSYVNCTYLIHRDDEVIMIDTGMKSDASDVKRALKSLNIPISRIKAILLTHWHNDHAAGTAELKQLTQCATYCHQRDVSYFQKKQSCWIRRLADYIPEHGIFVFFKGVIGDTVPRPAKIDHLVRDGQLLFDTFEVIHTPGHSAGHVSYYDKRSKVLFTGDAMAVVRGKLRLMSSLATPDKDKALQSIRRCLQGREISAICPGHRQPLTNVTRTAINEFLERIGAQRRWPLLG